jgi:hypothetical protein
MVGLHDNFLNFLKLFLAVGRNFTKLQWRRMGGDKERKMNERWEAKSKRKTSSKRKRYKKYFITQPPRLI